MKLSDATQLSVSQVAQILDCHRSNLGYWRLTGKMHFLRVGSQWITTQDEVDKFKAQRGKETR